MYKAALITLLALFALPTGAYAGGVEAGVTAPDFTLPVRGGDELTLSSLRGQPVVLNVWASWCAPCVKEMPWLDALHDSLSGVGVVVALNADEQRAPAEALLDRGGLDLPVVWDAKHVAVRALGPTKMPTTYVLDGEGVVRQVLEGGLSEDEVKALADAVRQLAVPSPEGDP